MKRKMTLEFQEFEVCMKEFLSLSSSLGDQWILKSTDSNEREYYLEKRCTVPCLDLQNSKNTSVIGAIHQNSFCVFVYHIVYSQSYCVPVLYFNAYHANGRLLTLDEIWKGIPECYRNGINSDKWHMITQQEHPKLGIPYFMIHPCYTAHFMSSCPSSNYIITWLSIVGPLVGIHLSLDYVKHVEPLKK